jgi:transcriptional regulator with XRE-family HTH domain
MGDSEAVPTRPHPDPSLAFVGKAIRALRQDSEMTQEQLALRAGVDPSYITWIEAGRRNISWVTMKQISQGLGLPASQLVLRIEEMERAAGR